MNINSLLTTVQFVDNSPIDNISNDSLNETLPSSPTIPSPVLKWEFENNLTLSLGSASLTLVAESTSYETGYNGIRHSLKFTGNDYYNITGTTSGILPK